jgi:hypothetical protein
LNHYNQFPIIDDKFSTSVDLKNYISKNFNDINFLFNFLGSSYFKPDKSVYFFNETKVFDDYKKMCHDHEVPVLLRHSSDEFVKKHHGINNEYIDIINKRSGFN